MCMCVRVCMYVCMYIYIYITQAPGENQYSRAAVDLQVLAP